MTMLAELNITKIGTFKDRAGQVIWKNTDDVIWTGSNIIYASLEGFAGDHYWDELIVTITPPQYTMDKLYGGHCKIPFGDIEFSRETVNQSPLWPPPVNFEISLHYTGSTESAKETMFQGMAHVAGFTRKSITYELYGENLDAQLLEEAEDYNGDTVPLPRPFGPFQHQQPVRLPDVGGLPTYHKAYLSGTLGTDWHIFDDGVNIDANGTDEGDYFTLSASPVGEVTISGVGEQTALSDIVQWACAPERLNHNFDNTYAESPSPEIWHWADTQQLLINFISEICASVIHLTYGKAQTLYLVHLEQDNGSRTLDGEDFSPVQYEYDPPVSKITAEWTERNAVEETIGKYIKETSRKTTVLSNFGYGDDEMTVTPYHTDKSIIDERLTAILAVIHKPTIRVPVILVGSLPVPGESISFTDRATVRDLAVTFNCWKIVYDYPNHQYIAEGKGVLS